MVLLCQVGARRAIGRAAAAAAAAAMDASRALRAYSPTDAPVRGVVTSRCRAQADASGAHGVVINRELSEAEMHASAHPFAEMARATHAHADEANAGASGSAAAGGGGGALSVHWRLGGPVCGGRLGVVSYTLLHCGAGPTEPISGGATPVPSIDVVAPPAADATGGASGAGVDAEAPPGGEGSAEAVTGPPPPCAAVRAAAAFGRPASLSPSALVAAVSALTDSMGRARDTRGEGGGAHAIICIGHCSWGRGQLQGELDRGSWQMFEARTDDVYAPNRTGDLWDRLRARERPLVPHVVAANDGSTDQE